MASVQRIADRIQEDPYRFSDLRRQIPDRLRRTAVTHDVRRQGLSGIKAVQTLSRLNRAHPTSTMSSSSTFRTTPKASPMHFRTTTARRYSARKPTPTSCTTQSPLSTVGRSTHRNRSSRSRRCSSAAQRDKLDPILDVCVAVYLERLDEDGQVDFRARPRRSPAPMTSWPPSFPTRIRAGKRLSILLNFLIPKLPAPREEDLSKGILESIDMDSYRVEKKAVQNFRCPTKKLWWGRSWSQGRAKTEPELDRLSNILKSFNEQYGTLFKDIDRITRRITDEVAPKGGRRPRIRKRAPEYTADSAPGARQGTGARDAGLPCRTTPRSTKAVSAESILQALGRRHRVRLDCRRTGPPAFAAARNSVAGPIEREEFGLRYEARISTEHGA